MNWQKNYKGEQGYSAYQVAVNNGFNGTVAQWLLSLKGKDGQQGQQGVQGIQGIQGAAGKDASIDIVTQAEYDALVDKSGAYFIGG